MIYRCFQTYVVANLTAELINHNGDMQSSFTCSKRIRSISTFISSAFLVRNFRFEILESALINSSIVSSARSLSLSLTIFRMFTIFFRNSFSFIFLLCDHSSGRISVGLSKYRKKGKFHSTWAIPFARSSSIETFRSKSCCCRLYSAISCLFCSAAL